MRKRMPVDFLTVITFDGRDYGVKAQVLPRVDQPHVSYDAGNRYWYARPAKVVSYKLFDDDGEDVTDTVWLAKDIEAVRAIILDHFTHPERDPLMVVAEGVYEEVVGCA